MAYVKQSHDIALQIKIALDEGQVELALSLLLAQKQTENSRSGPYGADNFNVGIEVAKAVEESHPQEAIEIYKDELVRRLAARMHADEATATGELSSHAKRSVLLLSSFMGLSKALEDLMSNQPLFQVTNHHGEACGVPPQIDEQTFPGVYRSYFENQNGEQAIFLYDYKQEHGTLYLGDAGWEHPYDVVDGKVLELMLSHPEQAWLLACWEASGALKTTRERIREERRRGL